jgi:hypothetical protein
MCTEKHSINIERVKINKNINVKIVRDDMIPGGTKQRAIDVFFKGDGEEYIYAGPPTGYAQVALAQAGKKHNEKVTVFLSKRNYDTQATKKARSIGAKIIYTKNGMSLKDLQDHSVEYKNKKKNRVLLPFGLDSDEFVQRLLICIKEAWGRKRKPERMWIVAGSATLLKVFHLIFPKCHFLIVQVGKKIWPDQLEGIKNTLYISPEKFNDDAEIQPPYPTVKSYDAKLWRFVLEDGQDGDFVWNVAKD